MAIYHCSVKAVSRSAGRSSTAAAAYRAGCEITDGRTGEVHDYTKKRGVESADIVLPDGAPEWANDRSALWNAAETAERRKDACVAREFEVALPFELSASERRRLAVDFAKEMANREGCAVDVAIHAPGKEGDNRNHHAHILRTTRKVGPDGLTDKLDTEKAGRNRGDDLAAVRTRWAELVNERLKENGIEARVDHRSLKDQGIDREPTSHKGPAVAAMERRGVQTDVGQRIGIEVAERLANARAEGLQERELAHTSKSIIDLAGDLKAALVERDQQLQIKQRQENEQRICSSLERIGSNVQAAGRAGADAHFALLASKQSLVAATGYARDIERGTQSAIEGAERRVAERDYGRVVEAARRKFKTTDNLVQQIVGHIEHVVGPIADAAQHIEIYTVERARQAKERAQAARQAAVATNLPTERQKAPVAPLMRSAAAVLANAAPDPAQSIKSEPKARAVELPAPTRLHADDAALFQRTEQSIAVAQASGSAKDIEVLANRFRKIDQVESELTRAATPNGWDTRPFDERSAAQQLANRDFDRRREAINAEAKAAGHTQLPFAVGQGTLITSTFDHSQKAAAEALTRHARSERPLGLFGRGTKDTKAWDTQMEALETNKAGWDKAIAWRDGKEAAASTADSATFHKRLDVVRKEYTAKSDAAIAKCAPARERLQEFAKERERLESLAEKALSPAKQRELSLERGRGHGMER
ncbi:hypothetical protein CSZ94_26870 [Janthinobacterium sp. ROICE36]|nr:hypothetical protein CSZ94_26870 [Janthinobacterium sp. ROICE36]